MKISDLQRYLAKVKREHGDLEIIEQRYSDFGSMGTLPTSTDVVEERTWRSNSHWVVVSASPQQDGAFFMRDHYSLSEEARSQMNFQTYLLYEGN